MGHRSADGSRAAKIKVGSVAEKLSWVLKLGRAKLWVKMNQCHARPWGSREEKTPSYRVVQIGCG